MVTILHTLEQRDSPVSRQILQAIDQIADKYNLLQAAMAARVLSVIDMTTPSVQKGYDAKSAIQTPS